jgi:hypothetical protein
MWWRLVVLEKSGKGEKEGENNNKNKNKFYIFIISNNIFFN